MSDSYYPLPQPEDIPVREREDAMGSYFMMFAALAAGFPLPILNLVAAVIYYYLNKGKSRFVHFHTLQSLISQIPTTLLNAGGVFWVIRIIFFDVPFDDLFKGYLVMIAIANLLYIIFSVVAAVKARKGGFYYFVFFGRLAYSHVFSISRNPESKEPKANVPPRI